MTPEEVKDVIPAWETAPECRPPTFGTNGTVTLAPNGVLHWDEAKSPGLQYTIKGTSTPPHSGMMIHAALHTYLLARGAWVVRSSNDLCTVRRLCPGMGGAASQRDVTASSSPISAMARAVVVLAKEGK